MIKEKYIPHLAIIAMLLMLALVAAGLVFNLTSSDEERDAAITKQPEYMSKIFDKDQLLQINIQIDESDWEKLKENAAAEEYYPADITINDATYHKVGIRAKGNSSLSMVASDDTTDRYSFKIKVDEYQEQNIYGLEKFVLNNMIGDATYMKEYLSYDMYKEMGIATPGYAFANITLNGEPWGVYLAVESLEESFAERNFGSLDGNLYKVESMGGMGGGGKAEGGNPPQMPNGGDNQAGQQNQETTNSIKQMSTMTAANEVPSAKPGEGNMQQPPEGMPQNNEKPAGDMPQMAPAAEAPAGNAELPSGETPGNNVQMPGEQSQNEQPALPQDKNPAQTENQGPDDNQGQMKGPGGMGSSGGANLVYSDDEVSSYSSIFNYTIFKKTTAKDYAVLINILKNLNQGTNLEESIDVEEVLKYFAINTFLVNLDSYAGNMKHNFYLYEEDGKLQILPWDYNLAFGAFEMTDASKVINFPIDTPVTDSMENSPLIAKLLEVDAYKEMYHDYLQELIDTYITSGKYKETIEKLDALIGDYVKEDATAFYTYDEYQTAIKELAQYGKDRSRSILAQISGEQPSTEYGSIATSINLMAMGQQNGGQGGPGGKNDQPGQDDMQGGPQGQGMPDMKQMQEVISIVGEASSADELTEDQKSQLAELGIDESTLQNLFTMKQNFGGKDDKGQHNGAPGQIMEQTKMSTEDKITAAVCAVLLLGGLIFALTFKRKRY